jgi:hypothetical protein
LRLKQAEVVGKTELSLYSPKGELRGALLEDGSIARMRPDEARASPSFCNRERRSRFVTKGSKDRTVVLSRPERSGPISTALCLRKARSPNSDALQVLAFATK